MLRLIYESGANNETTDITDHLRLYTWESTELAEEGSVGTSEITLDDPDGTLDIVAWRRMWAYETLATGSNSLIYYGWVADRRISRGPYRTGSGRVWAVSMVDQNAVLSFRVFRGSGASRPEETDVHRVEWLMDLVDGFGRAPIVEDEFVFGAGTKTMDAVDYKGQYTIDLLNDVAQMTGKNFYVYTKDNGYPSSQPTRGLWYGSELHTAYSSPLRLTNDLDDIDNTLTFAIGDGDTTVLERRADRVYSGAYGQYDGGAVYEQKTSTYNTFTQRDIAAQWPNVKSLNRATTRALRLLDTLDVEEDRITTAVYLPADKVNFIKPGMRVQFKATHLPDYEVYNWLRVLSRTVTEVAEGWEAATPHYYVSLVLSQLDPPSQITPTVSPDIVLEGCTDIPGSSDREAGDTAGVINAGETYFYEAINYQHEDNAFTEEFYLGCGGQRVDFVAQAGGNSGGVLQGTPGSGVYPAAFPTQTGTFVVTTGGVTTLQATTNGYTAGGPTFTDDCYRINLYRVG